MKGGNMERYPALRYSDSMWEDYKNGIWIAECDSLEGFEDRIEELKKISINWDLPCALY
jgi:hypothetical protein